MRIGQGKAEENKNHGQSLFLYSVARYEPVNHLVHCQNYQFKFRLRYHPM